MSDTKRTFRYIWKHDLGYHAPTQYALVEQYRLAVQRAPYDGSVSWRWSVVDTYGYHTIGTGEGLDDLHDAKLAAEDLLYRVLNGNPKFAKEAPTDPTPDPMLEEARKQTAALKRMVELLERLTGGC